MLDDFYRRVAEMPPKQMKTIDLSQLMIFNPGLLNQRLSNLDSLSDSDLIQIIVNNYKTILSEVVDKRNPLFINLFVNIRFISIFLHSLSMIDDMNTNNIVYINKIIYSYIYTNKNNIGIQQKQLYIDIAKYINRDLIMRLNRLNIEEELATAIALSRRLSNNEYENVVNTLYVIIKSNGAYDMFDDNMIDEIISILFNNLTLLIEGVMFNNVEYTDQNESEIFSRIINSVCRFLNQIPTKDMFMCISSISEDYRTFFRNKGIKPTFHLDCLSYEDYPRIIQFLDNNRYSNTPILIP